MYILLMRSVRSNVGKPLLLSVTLFIGRCLARDIEGIRIHTSVCVVHLSEVMSLSSICLVDVLMNCGNRVPICGQCGKCVHRGRWAQRRIRDVRSRAQIVDNQSVC